MFPIAVPDSPTVIRGVIDRPLATPSELLQAMLAVAEFARMAVVPYRIYVGDRPLSGPSLARWMPNETDRTVERYIQRVHAGLGAFGVIVNGIQAFHGLIGKRCADFLSRIGRRSPGMVLVDLFMGSYQASFFRVHKDEMDIFAFPVLGRKTYLCWPFRTFAAPAGCADPRTPCHPDRWIAYESARSAAVAMEAEPTDCVYWPASYWHLAESDPGTAHASINIGIRWTNGG